MKPDLFCLPFLEARFRNGFPGGTNSLQHHSARASPIASTCYLTNDRTFDRQTSNSFIGLSTSPPVLTVGATSPLGYPLTVTTGGEGEYVSGWEGVPVNHVATAVQTGEPICQVSPPLPKEDEALNLVRTSKIIYSYDG